MLYRTATDISVEEYRSSCGFFDIFGEGIDDRLSFEVCAAYLVAMSCGGWVNRHGEVKPRVKPLARE